MKSKLNIIFIIFAMILVACSNSNNEEKTIEFLEAEENLNSNIEEIEELAFAQNVGKKILI